jgi:hypothetical protein
MGLLRNLSANEVPVLVTAVLVLFVVVPAVTWVVVRRSR